MSAASGTRRALRFVLLIGAVSLCADATYEGARSIAGPYLAFLGAGALAVSLIGGLGELLGYGLRLVSGRLADRPRNLWPVTLCGYGVQMAAVPALALAGSWPVAALLMIVERIGKATRNPPRDVMLSHAGARIGGFGWAFGINEALDQAGAVVGPLVLAGVLALHQGGYRLAFAVLALPAALTLCLLTVARVTYPRPEEMEAEPTDTDEGRFAPAFWLYLGAAALIAAGFADFPLIAFRLHQDGTISPSLVPIFYAVAMGTGGLGSLLFGRLYDRHGFGVLVPLTLVSAAFAPLAFLGGPWPALLGVSLWGLGMGVHESLIPAAVIPMVPAHRRGSAYGLFTGVYGVAWFVGSAVIGLLYGVSIGSLVAFSVAAELAAVPLLVLISRKRGNSR
ncbi:MAG: MFS transporter [Solirubrobacterales bacterium 70-9]|nr:MAG: MFS transporter [Solirubrobacterales bacterium 70-9]